MEMSKKLAVTYARCAVAGSIELEDQLRRCRIFATNKGYRILHEICDEGSGLSLEREGLNTLRAVLKTGAIDVLLIISASRLAREPKQLKEIVDEIKSAQVTIELVK